MHNWYRLMDNRLQQFRVSSFHRELLNQSLAASPSSLVRVAEVLSVQETLRHRILQNPSLAHQEVTTAFEETAAILKASIRPLVDLAWLQQHWESRLSSFARVNSAIADASFLGEIVLPPLGDDTTEDDLVDEARTVLSESGAERSLLTLESVKFVPLTLLDKILRNPELMYYLTDRDFEKFIAGLIDELGFEDVELTPRSHDGGRDVLALKRVSGIPVLFAFECKRYAKDNPVGVSAARMLLGTLSHHRTAANKGVLVTSSSFTSGARNFIVSEPLLDGKDFDGIVGWLREYSERRRGR